MKVSIIVPIYNEQELIKKCLASLINQDYPKKDYEIVIVNDGSNDKTKENIEEIITKNKKVKIRLINQENKGRAIAREVGAKKAKYDNLLFIDSRCEAFPDVLKEVKKAKYQPLIGNSITDQKSYFGRFNYLIRKPLYKKYNENSFEKIKITEKNFDNISKGTTIFYVDKNLFLSSQNKDKFNKNTSEDTKMFRSMVDKKIAILKHPDVRVVYKPRERIREFINHTYMRGPRFVNYYMKSGRKYFPHIIAIFVLNVFFILSLIFWQKIFLLLILLFILLILGVSAYLSENLKDFFILVYLLPVTIVSFSIGILKGVLLKVIGR